MKDYPLWLLLLNGALLLPLLFCPLFLFGGAAFFRAENTALQALGFVLVQLVWLLPVVLAFKSLDLYRRGWTLRSVLVSLATLAALALCSWTLFMA